MMSFRNILGIVLLFVYQLNGQINPGYLGKKTSVTYQFNCSPAFFNPTSNNRISTINYTSTRNDKKALLLFPINAGHQLSIQRVFSRRFALQFSYGYFKTKTYVDLYSFRDLSIYIQNQSLSCSFKFYKKMSIAPFGAYWNLHLGYNFVSSYFQYSEYKEERYVNYSTAQVEQTVLNTGNLNYGFKTLNFGFSYGKSNIYKKCILIDRGIRFNAFLPSTQYTPDNNLAKKFNRRLLGHEAISFYLSVGYLF